MTLESISPVNNIGWNLFKTLFMFNFSLFGFSFLIFASAIIVLYNELRTNICGSKLNFSVEFKVFPCISATCGHFYHPECVAKLLQPANSQTEEFQLSISAGESFTCPAHKCFVCKQGEDKKVKELQFAMCRRCPKAYHRKCLPRHFWNFLFH